MLRMWTQTTEAVEDRRDAAREASHIEHITMLHPAAGNQAAILLDLSRIGLCFIATARLELDDEVTVCSPDGSKLPPLRIVIVRKSELDGSGEPRFEYGARYADGQDVRRHAWFLALRERREA